MKDLRGPKLIHLEVPLHVVSEHLNFKFHEKNGGFGTVDGRNPANKLRLVVYPIIYEVSYIPGGCLGFLPSTVSPQVLLRLVQKQ